MFSFKLCSRIVNIFLGAIFMISAFSSAHAQAVKEIEKKQAVVPRIAVIETNVFSDSKNGITRYASVVERIIDSDSDVYLYSISPLKKRLSDLNKQIELNGNCCSTEERLKLINQVETLKKEIELKERQRLEQYNKRYDVMAKPIFDEIKSVLGEYAKLKGFDLIINMSQDYKGLILLVEPSINITEDFISYYNKRFPPTK